MVVRALPWAKKIANRQREARSKAMAAETEAVADEAVGRIVRDLGADSGTLHLLGDDGLLHLKGICGRFPPAVLDSIRTIPVGKGMAGLAVERGQPVDACNIQTDTSGDVRPGAKATGMEGAIVVPVFDGQRVVGALGVANRGERIFSDEEKAALIAAGRALVSR
jgi:L-methionine (R)-S-oxide reductase